VRAETSAREAVVQDSARAEVHRALAGVLAQENDRAGALVEFRRAVELNPTDDASVLRLARNYAHVGQEEVEKDTYLATIARRPHCWQPYWWLATWYFRHGRFEESAVAYREMIYRAPELYRGYQSLGGILVLRGAYTQAIDTLKRAIALRPDAIAFDNLGTAYFNSRRLDDAVAAYNQAFQFGFGKLRVLGKRWGRVLLPPRPPGPGGGWLCSGFAIGAGGIGTSRAEGPGARHPDSGHTRYCLPEAGSARQRACVHRARTASRQHECRGTGVRGTRLLAVGRPAASRLMARKGGPKWVSRDLAP
jgi:cytochrome c-type biogenesis protein CcmH/NrfG